MIPEASASALQRYRTHMERRALRPRSIEKLEGQLLAFARWLGPAAIIDATRDDLERFLDSRGIGPRTRYHWLASLHMFYKWAQLEDLAEHDPTVRIVRPKVFRPLPRPIGDEDLARALAAAPPQWRAMLALAAYQGLRCQEIAALDRVDVLDGQTPALLVIREGKGGRQRVLPLHAEALSALRSMPMARAGRLFRRPRGGPYTPNALSRYLNGYLAEQGIPATAHQLRHWFGTNVYRSTRDLRLTQELMGHSDPGTTAGYVAWSPTDAADAVASLRIG